MKKIIIVSLIVICFLIITPLLSATENDDKIKDLNEKIGKLNTTLEGYNKQIQDIEKEISIIKNDSKNSKTEISNLENEINNNEDNIKLSLLMLQESTNSNTLADSLFDEDADLNKGNKTLGMIFGSIDQVDRQVSRINKITYNEENVNENITKEKDKLKEVEDKKNKINEEISKHQGEIDEIKKIESEQKVADLLGDIPSNGDVSGKKDDLMTLAGISSSDFAYVDHILFKESTWNYLAKNSSSGAYGLCQALPASKMASIGSDYLTNPVTQLKWCNQYAKDRYGSWEAAYNFWINNNWW